MVFGVYANATRTDVSSVRCFLLPRQFKASTFYEFGSRSTATLLGVCWAGRVGEQKCSHSATSCFIVICVAQSERMIKQLFNVVLFYCSSSSLSSMLKLLLKPNHQPALLLPPLFLYFSAASGFIGG